MTLTYLEFHLLFVVPPLALLAVAVRPSRAEWAGIGLLALLAFAYTTPWDNYLIYRGVWSYGEGTLLGRVGYTPFGEYAFFALQPVLTGLWYYRVAPEIGPEEPPAPFRARTAGAAAWLALALAGGLLLTAPSGYYMGAILLWAGPVAALQWGFGGPVLYRHRRLLAVAVGVPTLYLCFADAIAIGNGVWTISPALSSGVLVLGLPIEEAVFFLVTNVLVVNGLVLLDWVLARVAVGGVAHGVEGLVPDERVVARVRARWG